MTAPARVDPDGQMFAGNAWADVIVLPTHRTNDDGTQGTVIDWSGSVFTADSPDLPIGASITVTPNLAGSPPTVTLAMTAAGTAVFSVADATTGEMPPPVFRWYLHESVLYGGDVFLWRLVRVSREL